MKLVSVTFCGRELVHKFMKKRTKTGTIRNYKKPKRVKVKYSSGHKTHSLFPQFSITPEYMKMHLGVSTTVSFLMLLKKICSKEDIIAKIRDFPYKKDLLIKLSCLANHVALKGLLAVAKDKVQYDLLKNYIARNVRPDAPVELGALAHAPLFIPQTFNVIYALIFEFTDTAEEKEPPEPNLSIDVIVFLFLALNDYSIAPTYQAKLNSDDKINFYIDLIRSDFFGTPQMATPDSYRNRTCRFYIINENLVNILESNNTISMIDESLKNKFDLTLNELRSIVFALNAIWLSSKNPIASPPSLDVKKSKMLNIDKVIKVAEILSNDLASDEWKDYHLKNFNDVRSVIKLLETPFVDFRKWNDRFMLLAPHILTRKMDEVIVTTYLKTKKKEDNVQDFYGAHGKAYEQYISYLMKNIFNRSRGFDYLEISPQVDSGELCDIICIRGEECFIFEIKSKRPNLSQLDFTLEGQQYFKSWLEMVFIKGSKGKGKAAFEQIMSAKKIILKDGYKNYKPTKFYPFVILYDEFAAPGFINEAIKLLMPSDMYNELCSDGRYVVLSVNDIEFCTDIQFTRNCTFLDSLKLKSINFEYSKVNYVNFSKKLHLKTKYKDSILMKHFEEISTKNISYFKD